ncbi:hypothetical protein C7534_12913 [Pseudomonas sp. OV226]|nr:hypothetical protein C7534_12913 [Pseudomonas sp. OV226]
MISMAKNELRCTNLIERSNSIRKAVIRFLQLSCLLLFINFSVLVFFYDWMQFTQCLDSDLGAREKPFFYFDFFGFEYASNLMSPCLIKYCVGIFSFSIFYSAYWEFVVMHKAKTTMLIMWFLVVMVALGAVFFTVDVILCDYDPQKIAIFSLMFEYFSYLSIAIVYFVEGYVRDGIIFFAITISSAFFWSRRAKC